MSNSAEENISSRELRHFVYVWDVINPFALHTILSGEFFTTPFKIHPKDKDTWYIGLKKTKGSNPGFSILLLRLGLPKQRYLNVHINVISKHGIKLNFDKSFKICLKKEWQSSPFVKIHRHLRYIEIDTVGCENIEVWRITICILYYEDVPNWKENVLLYERGLQQVGIDLLQYVAKEKFSDLVLHLNSGESFPLHKAVVESRCPEFIKHCNSLKKMKKLQRYSYETLFYFFLFLYGGSFEQLIDCGIMPIHLHTLAREMKVLRLAYLTCPDILHVYTHLNTKTIAFVETLGKSIMFDEIPISVRIRDFYPSPYTRLRLSMIKTYHARSFEWYVGFLINMIIGNFAVDLILEIELVSEDGQFSFIRKKLVNIVPNGMGGIPDFFTVSFLRKNFKKFGARDKLKFVFTLTINKQMPESKTINYHTRYKNKQQELFDKETSRDCIRILSGDFLHLLNESSYSDINVILHEKTFALNKIILAARSKWFSSRIDELHSPHLYIDSIDSIIFGEILREIYAGRSRVKTENSMELYRVANEFQLENLKHKCVFCLKGSVTPVNCIKILEFAVTYNEEYFKNCILDWCKTKGDEIRMTDDWNRIIRNNPSLAQLLTKSFSST